jgi:hypothetical protein
MTRARWPGRTRRADAALLGVEVRERVRDAIGTISRPQTSLVLLQRGGVLAFEAAERRSGAPARRREREVQEWKRLRVFT